MSSRSKASGTAFERALVAKARAQGLEASRQPLSGVLRELPNDVVLEQFLVEAKTRRKEVDASGERYIRVDLDWLTGVRKHAQQVGYQDGLCVVNSKYVGEPLVVVGLSTFLSLLQNRKKS